MYIDTAEKHRIEFHNNPTKFRGVFEKLLPYAIIFGLEKKWSEEFKEIYQEPPTWYQGDISAFNSYLLASSISDISRNVKSKSAPPNSLEVFVQVMEEVVEVVLVEVVVVEVLVVEVVVVGRE